MKLDVANPTIASWFQSQRRWRGVADPRELGAVSPLPPEELRELFGTEQPTLEAIEKSDEFIDTRQSPFSHAGRSPLVPRDRTERVMTREH